MACTPPLEDLETIDPGPDDSPCWDQGGEIIADFHSPLPLSYDYLEYCAPEPDDDVECTGATNDSAELGKVFLAQTHLMEPEWPLFYLAADRPAYLQVQVDGSGEAPDVRVEATSDDGLIGRRCLAGPGTLSDTGDLAVDDRSGHFTATLPRTWLKEGVSLEITAGPSTRTFSVGELGLGPEPELNLVVVPMSVLNYNAEDQDIEPRADFLPDFASAMPASHTRLARFPTELQLPTLASGGPWSEEGVPPVLLDARLCRDGESEATHDCSEHPELHDGDINATALLFIDALFRATGDFSHSYYYGHTGGLFPGGWGGGKAFVSADYEGITIHEGGHALSLPHWGQGPYQNTEPEQWDYRYPYGGVEDDGGGRGDSWNYYQNIDELISPLCEDTSSENYGEERSDAMQRNNYCLETRSDGPGPWDGFSDFSAYSMFRHMNGAAEPSAGTVPYERSGEGVYHLPITDGYPTLRFDGDGNRTLTRHDQSLDLRSWETLPCYVPQEWNIPVYTVYGSYHPAYDEATILYEPLQYQGNLPGVVDPTDPETFADLATFPEGPYRDHFWWEKDLTLKFIYEDGSALHAIYPYGGVGRDWTLGAGPWRRDMLYFALTVPADQPLARVELYHRPFVVQYPEYDTEGNITHAAHGITAENFMDAATLLKSIDL